MLTATLQRPLLARSPLAVLLLIPAVAMQFTSEVFRGPGDSILAAVLLSGAGSAMVITYRHEQGTVRRAAVIFAIAVALARVWAELAVRLFP